MSAAKRIHYAGFALIAAVVICGELRADTVTLRAQAYVRGGQVRLADVADIAGGRADELRAVELGAAAAPGVSKRLDASLITARVLSAGFDAAAVEVRGAPAVTVTTMSLELSAGSLAEDLRAFIQREMPWDADAALVDVTPPPGDLRLPDGDVTVVWRPDPQYEYLGAGNFRGEVRVNGEVARTVFAKANVAAYDAVVVATQPLGRGDVVGPNNARLEKRELSTLDAGAFFSMDEAAGRVARTSIQPGQVLTSKRLDRPILVKRNQFVAVETRVGGLIIRGQAKSQSEGAVGDVVTCANLSSGDKFSGVVRADGVVEVK